MNFGGRGNMNMGFRGRGGGQWRGRGGWNNGGNFNNMGFNPNQGGFNPNFGPPQQNFGGGPPNMMMGMGNDQWNDQGEGGPQCGGFPPPGLQPGDVLAWMDHQHPFVLRRIYFHVKWLFQQHGIKLDGEWENGDDESNEESQPQQQKQQQPQQQQVKKQQNDKKEAQNKGGPAEDWYNTGAMNAVPPPPELLNSGRGGRGRGGGGGGRGRGQLQWTPGGWAPKDNSHKVTTMMRPLPERDIIPPSSDTFKEAAADREKLKMLKNNLSMMQFELTKICKRFRIQALDRDNLDQYPDD